MSESMIVLDRERFYEKCAEILGIEYESAPLDEMRESSRNPGEMRSSRTRWTRGSGNGRYPGWGIIRVFGDVYHVALTNPTSVKTFYSQAEVFDHLRKAVVARNKA